MNTETKPQVHWTVHISFWYSTMHSTHYTYPYILTWNSHQTPPKLWFRSPRIFDVNHSNHFNMNNFKCKCDKMLLFQFALTTDTCFSRRENICDIASWCEHSSTQHAQLWLTHFHIKFSCAIKKTHIYKILEFGTE